MTELSRQESDDHLPAKQGPSAEAKVTAPEGESAVGEEEDNGGPPEEVMQEVMKSMPPAVRRQFLSMTSMMSGPQPHPVLKKVNEEHIHKVLDYSHTEDKLAHDERASERKYGVFYAIFGAVFILGAITLLVKLLADSHPQLLSQIFIAIVSGVGGFGGGYGFCQYRKSRDD